jgi:hypothetical protein
MTLSPSEVTELTGALIAAQPNEKCDAACPANSLVAVLMPSGQRLTFCGHHYDSQSTLHRIEVQVLDSRKMGAIS